MRGELSDIRGRLLVSPGGGGTREERVAATRWHPGEKCFAIGGSAAHANML